MAGLVWRSALPIIKQHNPAPAVASNVYPRIEVARCLNESCNLRYDHTEDLSNLLVCTLIHHSAHCRNSAICILGIAVDVPSVGRNVAICRIELSEQALRRVQIIHSAPIEVSPR